MVALTLQIDSSMDYSMQSQPTKLFLGGITKTTTTKQLREHFQRFGRVLDCVAMRQPDGKSRGFGYVTLDSPAAASKCLNSPQVIDNRVIDVKLAVPEGSAGSTPATPMSAMSASSPSFSMGAYEAQWPMSPWHGNMYDVMPPWACASPCMSGYELYSTHPAMEYTSSPPMHEPAAESPKSASDMEPVSISAGSLTNKSMSRRGLTDVTNLQGELVGEAKKVSLVQKPASGRFGSTTEECNSTESSPKNACASPMRVRCMVQEEDEDLIIDDADTSADVSEDLPSRGSAKHASGECQRCNFFSNGRCTNGRDCSFCHFEHDKKKVTRNEKRERRERWLAKQSNEQQEVESRGDSHEKENDAMMAPPGLTPVKSTAERCAMSAMTSSTVASTPSSVPSKLFPPRSLLATSPIASQHALQLLSTTPSPNRSEAPAHSPLQPMKVTMGTQTDSERSCFSCGHGKITRAVV